MIVGAASKGIIQRDHQHNAVVYRSYYAANPFENMSEEEVDAYKREVERRERGEEPGKTTGNSSAFHWDQKLSFPPYIPPSPTLVRKEK